MFVVGLNRTGHMSVQPGQDRTPKFAGRVLPDRTSTGPILLSKFVRTYGLLEAPPRSFIQSTS